MDRTASFPKAAHDALVASDFHAPHVPEEYGGVGADAVASAIVVEEVARVCASSSLIPGANKLGSTPLILAGSEDLKQKYLPPLAEGATTFSYALSEREAGSDAASMRTRATADGDDWVLNGQKSLDHERRCLRLLHRPRRHRPRRPARLQRQRLRRREVRRRVLLRREGEQARDQGLTHP